MASKVAQLGYPNPVSDSASGGPDEEDDVDDISMVFEDEDDPVDYETTCPARGERHIKLYVEFAQLVEDMERRGEGRDPFPPKPLRVLPETTDFCIDRSYCYHREYMTNNTGQTESTLALGGQQQMLQICSVRLSKYKSESYPIAIYGIFAVRDDLEPLRNYVFNRSRDNPVPIHQDVFALPLCSPCRGMYVLDHALLEVDLWKLQSAYVEINVWTCFDEMMTGWIHSDHCLLDMDYIFMRGSIEAVIQVFKTTDDPHPVRFSAFRRCFDFGINLFEGKCVENGLVFQHIVAVKAKEKLVIRLELNNSHFEWDFQDGAVGASNYPDVDSIFNQFHVRVFFAPKKGPDWMPSRYHDWLERCRTRNKGSTGLLK
ncbi:hypothetical protein BS78_K047900 [Paspalum vaginatum]|uniref:DUF6598 domain-containing protein n=1 Tax=Paspalum vaginatum TaxID=158149 RepID=A0A9W7XDJ9_9POAL|nr:hypothetical protein BS78_K047900 [Paspalum vaginatum]